MSELLVSTHEEVEYGDVAGQDMATPAPELSRRNLFRLALGLASGAALLAACSEGGSDERPEAGTPSEPVQATSDPEVKKSRQYPLHTEIMATVFHIGEEASAANANISNIPTSWDKNSVQRFGGVDDPSRRLKDGGPVGFKPKHNTYYFALPANEFDENEPIEGAHEASPWADETIDEGESLFKGRWIEVERGGTSIYAQWVDCGPSDDPNGIRDYEYVFGDDDARPKNTFGLKAGLDLSPAAANALGFGIEEGGAKVSWRFVEPADVPDGPWKDYPPIDNQTFWS
jgi:hypothetical protein